jgi:hypothetical protein
MGVVPKKREAISPGKSSQWGVGTVAEKEIGRIMGIKGWFWIRARRRQCICTELAGEPVLERRMGR